MVRIKSDDCLAEFGLVYVKGQLKMSFAPGRTLIGAEEMNVIASLGGIPL